MTDRVLFVGELQDGKFDVCWTWHDCSGATYRFNFPALPTCKSRDECQQNLDTYASSHRLRLITTDLFPAFYLYCK
jgi:hypothetical protein